MNSGNTFKVTIIDGSERLEVHAPAGDNLISLLRRVGKNVSSPCGGKGTCKKCTVTIEEHQQQLSCQYSINSDITVTLGHTGKANILHEETHPKRKLPLNSGIQFVVEGPQQRLVFGEHIIRESINTAIDSPYFGIAVDIGTTTVVLYLMNLTTGVMIDVAAFLNPQAAYGHDVISRISYTIEHADGLHELRQKIVNAISKAIIELCNQAQIRPENIYKMTVAGNTTMLHLLAGISPSSIAFAPFTPAFTEQKTFRASEFGFPMEPGAIVILFPSLSGYVGGDIVSGMAATGFADSNGFSLFIDIGTNGEMAIGNRDVIYTCATAAGPAFEGATISCGIGGVEGALSSYRNGEYKTIGNAKVTGICGSGLIDIVADLINKERIDMTGYMESNYLIERQESTGVDHDIVLTPQDVREVQLAKAAIAAGIAVLMGVAKAGFDDIDALYLAGGFGNYMDADSAMRIGLLPPQLKGKIIPVGNSAGTGARLLLTSTFFQREIDAVLARSQYIELSMRQDFNDAYVNQMMFE